jgi:hypothetical protein
MQKKKKYTRIYNSYSLKTKHFSAFVQGLHKAAENFFKIYTQQLSDE